MKGVVICGLEMPKQCWDCPCHDDENGRCKILGRSSDYIPRDCPMYSVEIYEQDGKEPDEEAEIK